MTIQIRPFPHMSFKNGLINKIKCRVMRISFTGELSYEINVQANYGQSVWEKCMEAGKEYGITRLMVQRLCIY